MLTMSEIAKHPEKATFEVESKNAKMLFRPLISTDVSDLTAFLEGLSPRTRHLSSFDGYGRKTAEMLCEAIAKYDKVRFVLVDEDRIVGLLELSLDIPEEDLRRYAQAGIILDPDRVCRFGPTLADDYQNRGLGASAFERVRGIVSEMGKERIILWGGVLAENESAIRYYERLGFIKTGEHERQDGARLYDMMLVL